MKRLVVIPVYNEATTLRSVLASVREQHHGDIVVVDDGSDDETPSALAQERGLRVITHPVNRGYGRSLIDGFDFARAGGYDEVLTMDCDGQHEPHHIGAFFAALHEGAGVDIVSGSRYLPRSRVIGKAPAQRRLVNGRITALVNARTGWSLTDAFCGFKAYRMSGLAKLRLREDGYAMPMELWAKALHAGLTVRELPIERIYFDHDRSFGADLDDPERRFAYYVRVWDTALADAMTTAQSPP